jgi:hypothetical protein
VVVARNDARPPRTARLTGPDGVPVFEAEFLLADTALTCRAPSAPEPGTYRVELDGRTAEAVRVNPHPRESDAGFLSPARRDALFPSPGDTRTLASLSAGDPLARPRTTPLGCVGLLTLESCWLAWGRR